MEGTCSAASKTGITQAAKAREKDMEQGVRASLGRGRARRGKGRRQRRHRERERERA